MRGLLIHNHEHNVYYNHKTLHIGPHSSLIILMRNFTNVFKNIFAMYCVYNIEKFSSITSTSNFNHHFNHKPCVSQVKVFVEFAVEANVHFVGNYALRLKLEID